MNQNVVQGASQALGQKPEASTFLAADRQSDAPVLNRHNWHAQKSTSAVDGLRAQMNADIEQASRFINHHLEGQPKARALKGLKAFEQGKVNCKTSERLLTTFTLNRDLLHSVVSKLHDASLPLDLRKGCAENLFSSLGVCQEGEASHFQEAALNLSLSSSGFETKLAQLKQSTARQNLQELVCAVKADSASLADMEIHHVNGLLNHHAAEFGLVQFQDAYVIADFVKDHALPARQLLADALSPQRVSWALAEQLGGFAQSGTQSLRQSFSADKLQAFEQALKLEWGNQFSLHDLLELDPGDGSVLVKSTADLQLSILNCMQKSGLLPAGQSASQLAGRPPERVQLADLHGIKLSATNEASGEQALGRQFSNRPKASVHQVSSSAELLEAIKRRKRPAADSTAMNTLSTLQSIRLNSPPSRSL